MSVLSESYRSRSLSSRRSASLRRKRSRRQDSLLRGGGGGGGGGRGGDGYSLDNNTLRSSVRSQTLSLRAVSPKPTAIDPELRDAQKHGTRYHISMDLNALLDFPLTDSVLTSLERQRHNYGLGVMPRSLSPSYSLHHSPRLNVMRSTDTWGRQSVVSVGRDSFTSINNSGLLALRSKSKTMPVDDGFAIVSVKASSVDNFPHVMTERAAAYDDGYVIRSVTPSHRIKENIETGKIIDETVSFDLQLIGTESMKSKASKTTQQRSDNLLNYEDTTDGIAHNEHQLNKDSRWNDKAADDGQPSISMAINETMTMDYYQPEEPKRFTNKNSISKQTKSSKSTHSKTKRDSEKTKTDSEKTKRDSEKTKTDSEKTKTDSEKTAPEVAPTSVHRNRPKAIPTTKSVRKETTKAISNSRDPSGSSTHAPQRYWSNDEVDTAKNLDRIRKNKTKPAKDVYGLDKDFMFRKNFDITPSREASFDRNAVGKLARDSSHHQPTKTFTKQDSERDLQRQVSNAPIVPNRQQLTMSPRPMPMSLRPMPMSQRQMSMSSRQMSMSPGRTVFQDEELIPLRTAKLNSKGSDDEYQTEIQITRGHNKETRMKSPFASLPPLPPMQPRIPTAMTSTYVRQIMTDAPDGSFRQRMDVHREEDQIKGPLPNKAGSSLQDSGSDLLNVDLVSEKVDMKLIDGVAQLVVTVRCERIVPIHGSVDLYKKTSIVVTRTIDVDLTVTEERKKIYDQVMQNRQPSGKLSNKDTFELYIAFMEVAELHPSGGLDQEQLWIDRKVDEEKVGKYVSLEKRLGGGASEFSARRRSAALQHATAEGRGRLVHSRNLVSSSPVSTHSLSERFLTSPKKIHENYYDGPNAVFSPSSGCEANSFRSMSGNDTNDKTIQLNDSENSRRNDRHQVQNVNSRDRQFADGMFSLHDEHTHFVTTSDKNYNTKQQDNEHDRGQVSLKNPRVGLREIQEKGDRSWNGQVNWNEAIGFEEYRGDIGLSARPVGGTEEECRTLVQSQEQTREVSKEPSYEVFEKEENRGGEYFEYEEIKFQPRNDSKYMESSHRGANEGHLRSSEFSRSGKTSIVC